jgi:glycosyltransferase involved in cell wall biosynthesis
MIRPKYSIVIPSFRGFESLKIIIPYILSIDRDDFEVIVSINHSEDANITKEFLLSLFDKRLKIFTP